MNTNNILLFCNIGKRIMTKIDDKEKIDTEDTTEYPSCYANYCKTHDACQKCKFKESCKLIKQPKEPGWCQ
jgi:hypothetical protein